ncbi:MAG: hypothetical protein JNK82_07730 [Myxococcaceae bacterium]|nr:hypothetical protein [Myxococcaceae bacterium]
MRTLAALSLVTFGAVAHADSATLFDNATYLGFSKKHQQFAVRRTLQFKLGAKPAANRTDASCARVCRARGRPFVERGGPPSRAGECPCGPATVWSSVETTDVTLDLVEVYTADGALKRSFIEKASDPELFAKLKANLASAPVDDALDIWLQRDLTDGERWRAYQADAAFTAGPGNVRQTSNNRCELAVQLGEGSPTEVSFVIKGMKDTPTVAKLWVEGYDSTDAWWLPGPKPTLVGVVHSKPAGGPRDDLVIVPASKVESCAK